MSKNWNSGVRTHFDIHLVSLYLEVACVCPDNTCYVTYVHPFVTGGCILGTRCTESYKQKTRYESFFNIFLWRVDYSPRVVIQVGSCANRLGLSFAGAHFSRFLCPYMVVDGTICCLV